MIDAQNNLSSLKAFVDFIENDLAAIISSDGKAFQFHMPLDRLPSGIKAGDHLVVSFQIDTEMTESTLKSITELQNELTKSTQPDKFKL